MAWQQSRLLVNSSVAALVSILLVLQPVGRAEEDSVPLPRNVRAVWDLSKASRETTPTRERICINGLWRWQPAETHGRTAYPPGTGATSRFPAAGRESPTTCRRTARRVYRASQLEGATAA